MSKRWIIYVEPGGNQHAYNFPSPPLHPRIIELRNEVPRVDYRSRTPFVRVPCSWQIPLGP
jgi:hypothetical protein